MKAFLHSLGFKLYKKGGALLLGLLALWASALPSSAFAACTLSVTSVSATPAAAVDATVTARAVLQYAGCQGVSLAIKDNAPANLSYASCGVLGANWNCASVATASDVTTSTFVSGNNGNKTETLIYSYTAAAIGCPSISITPVIAGVAGTARASTCSAAPSVSTNPATGTAGTSATLNGTVVSNGNAVTAITFQYGTSSGVYGAPVPATPGTLVAGAAATAVSKTVSGLTCGTTYFYRANATNNQGTTNGPEQSFKACFSLTKVASSANVPVGTNFTYALTASNATGSSLSNVVVTDDVSAPGLSYLSCTTAIGSCSASGTLVTWALGNLANATTATATLTVQASTSGAKTNTASANTTGTPVATSVVNAYAPLADWRMDEASWNGTAGEVKDSTGNGYNGKAAKAAGTTAVPNTLATAPLAKSSGGRSTCSYGDFVRGAGPVRTHSYVELTGIPPLPTSFTFAAWIRTTDNATSGQRILVRDDADNGWGFSLGDAAPGKIRLFNRKIGAVTGSIAGDGSIGCGAGPPFCLDTKNVITNNSWFFIALAVDTTAKTVSHYIFDSAGSIKSSTSATFTGTWTDGTGLASIGGETQASGEGKTADYHFKGNIDELQIYQGVLSQADLGLLLTRTRTCAGSGPDHVELVHSGTALTCSPKAIKVLGCTTAASCKSSAADQYVGNVTLTPDTYAGAQWCTDALCTATFSGAITVASGTTLYLREPTVRTDTLGGTAVGTLTGALQCANTATSAFGTHAAACNLAFAGTGFLVSVPNHTACTAQTVTLQAVQSSATGNTCAPAFQGVNRTVSLYAGYTNPTTGTQTASLNYVTTAGGSSTPVVALSMAPGSPTTLSNLYFDNTGTARLTGFTYPDTGQVTLYPSYTGSVATNDSDLVMAASGGNVFVTAPAGFVFSGIPAAPLTAGTAFNVTVTAQNACATPATTQNFGRETGGASVTVASSNPLPGMGNATAISETLTGFSSGAASASVQWNEVGTVDLVASAFNYLGSALSPSSTQAAVGRFKPAYFDTSVLQGCSSFTYSGQPMSVSVTAKAAGGSNTTANYAGSSWARLVTLADANGGTGTWAAHTIAASSFANGVGTAPFATYTFPAAATPPATVKLRASEPLGADGVDSSTGAEGTSSIRSGRIRLQNIYGSELLALKIPVRIEHFNTSPATGWHIGTDTCTSLSAANFAFSYPVNAKNNMSACETAGTLTGVHPVLSLSLSKPCTGIPCAGNSGWTDLALNLGSAAIGTVAGSAYGKCTAVGAAGGAETPANLPWLKYNWLGAGQANPAARANFGSYKSPLIYMRENY